MTHSRPPATSIDPTHGHQAPTSEAIDDFVESELASTADAILRARYRAHAAAMIAITRTVAAEFPTATDVLIDRSTRWSVAAGPTLVEIRDGNSRQLLTDDARETRMAEHRALFARVDHLLAESIGDASLTHLGWIPDNDLWRRSLTGSALTSRSWKFVTTAYDPGAPWACCYARADCPLCRGRGRITMAGPLWLCRCAVEVR